MVDREARDKCAELVRHLANGRITEDDFDTALGGLPLSGNDPVFGAVFEESFSIETTPRRDVARWILFLQSDAEYQWPGLDQLPNCFHIIAGVVLCLVLGVLLHNVIAAFWLAGVGTYLFTTVHVSLYSKHRKPGDLTVWPFHKRDDLNAAMQHPRLLNGGHLNGH